MISAIDACEKLLDDNTVFINGASINVYSDANLTNLVLNTIMTKKLGDIQYDENEFLRQDKDYIEPRE